MTSSAWRRVSRGFAAVDMGHRSVLSGNVRPEARAANDRGRVPDTLPLPHLQLLLMRPAERAAALQQAIRGLHDLLSARCRGPA